MEPQAGWQWTVVGLGIMSVLFVGLMLLGYSLDEWPWPFWVLSSRPLMLRPPTFTRHRLPALERYRDDRSYEA